MNVTRPNLVFLLQLPENTRWILCKPCVLVCVCMSVCGIWWTHSHMDVWACMWVYVHVWRVCVCVCVCICEQVAGIFEDDSRGLTHARPNKATLWWSLCDTLSLGLWGLSLPHTHVHNTHTLVHTVPRVSSGAPRQIVKAALWLLRVSVRPVCGLMMTHCTLSTNAIDPSRHLCTPVLGTATHISSCKRTTTYVCFEMFWMLLSLVKSSWITWSAVRHAKLENHNRIYTILMRTIIR